MTLEPPPLPALRTSGRAIAALILGLLAFVLGPFTGIPAIILGFAAASKIRHDPTAKGAGLALAGAITGIVGTLLIVVVALPIVLLIPALNHARAAAQRAQEASNMHQIYLACVIYATEYETHYPPHLAAALPELVSPSCLVERGHTPPTVPPSFDPKAWRSLVPEVDAHCDFVYVGADLPPSDAIADSSAIILFYAKPSVPEGRNIAFADGRVAFVPAADLPRTFDQSNRARARYKLPPITLDAPPPPAR